ncbi:MAG: hypothetical protein KC800_16625 [Candidatus Eremiobacteraeota bacterium]|nr:hypothetical protein [Candidatus Eremiobacteraeota bacterium]
MRTTLIIFTLLISTLAAQAQPPGYDFIRSNGKVVRQPLDSLPWRIYVSDERHFEAFVHAVRTWNGAGHRLGYPDLFAVVRSLSDADMVVDWSGKGLPPDKAAGVWWDIQSDQAHILKFVMDPLHRIPEGNRSQILLQELGHVLGLGDSSDTRDVMHPLMHSKRYRNVKSANPSSRDLQAFNWLYTQNDFIPIVSNSRRSTGPAAQPISPSQTALQFDPIKVEITGSVNVRLIFRNTGEETVRGPFALELWGRGLGDAQWVSLKTWNGIDKVPAGYRVSRDYFSELQPLFQGRFELLCNVRREESGEVLGEARYP